MWWNNKLFPSLNIINIKSSPYGSNGILRHYHYGSDPKLGLGIVSIRGIPCSFHAFKTISSLSWDSKIKESCNQPRYGLLYSCNFSCILGCQNNWIIMIFFNDGTYEENYKHINQTILDGNLINMSLVIMEGNCGAVDSDCY